jgi:hypothetical protein
MDLETKAGNYAEEINNYFVFPAPWFLVFLGREENFFRKNDFFVHGYFYLSCLAFDDR